MDLGQPNTQISWKRLGINPKKIGKHPPGPDDDEDLTLTLSMLAWLQNFPAGWKFQGPKQAVFRQIANALPSVVALHLGCAIRSALTGVYVDPKQELRRYYRSYRLAKKPVHTQPGENSERARPAVLPKSARHLALPALKELMRRVDQCEPEDLD
jgi:hypothetical protein